MVRLFGQLNLIIRNLKLILIGWKGCQFDLKYFRNGLCHLTKQAAEAHAKVLTAICKGDV